MTESSKTEGRAPELAISDLGFLRSPLSLFGATTALLLAQTAGFFRLPHFLWVFVGTLLLGGLCIAWRRSCGWKFDTVGLHVLIWPKWVTFPYQGLKLTRLSGWRRVLFDGFMAESPGQKARLIPGLGMVSLPQVAALLLLRSRGVQISPEWETSFLPVPDEAVSDSPDEAVDLGDIRLVGRTLQRIVAAEVSWEVSLIGATLKHEFAFEKGRSKERVTLHLGDGRMIPIQAWSSHAIWSQPDYGVGIGIQLMIELARRGVRVEICGPSECQDPDGAGLPLSLPRYMRRYER